MRQNPFKKTTTMALRNAIGLTQIEIGIVFSLLFLLTAGLVLARFLQPKPLAIDEEKWAQETASLDAKLTEIETHWQSRETGGDLDQASPGFKLNPNTAEENEFLRLPGIGAKLAQRIISYRKQMGPFASIDELAHIKGIGNKKLQKIRPFLVLE